MFAPIIRQIKVAMLIRGIAWALGKQYFSGENIRGSEIQPDSENFASRHYYYNVPRHTEFVNLVKKSVKSINLLLLIIQFNRSHHKNTDAFKSLQSIVPYTNSHRKNI